MNYTDVEPLRASFRPKKINILFVGESAPAGGAFFYKGYGQVHDELRRVLLPFIGSQPSFLTAFHDSGLYLDDLVLEPVNWMSSKERKALHKANSSALAERLQAYRPSAVIAFMKAIQQPVEEATRQANLDCPCYTVSFPGNGRQKEFREGLARILPKLL